MKKWLWTDEAMEQRLRAGEDIELCDRCIRLEYPDRKEIVVVIADIVFQKELLLDLGGVHCLLKNIGGTHSENSISIYVPEEKTLFIGDSDCEDHFTNHGKYDKTILQDLIHYIKETDFWC